MIPLVPEYIDFSLCYKYSKEYPEKLFCGEITMHREHTPEEYFKKYGVEEIKFLINEFEM